MTVSTFRKLTVEEDRVLRRLIEAGFPGDRAIAAQLKDALVREIDEHGCLEFQTPSGPDAEVVHRVPVEAQYEDADEVPVLVLLHVVSGRLNELELVKGNGSRILRRPNAAELVVTTNTAA